MEINVIQNIRTEEINETKVIFFSQINEMIKTLVRLTKNKKAKIINIRNETVYHYRSIMNSLVSQVKNFKLYSEMVMYICGVEKG